MIKNTLDLPARDLCRAIAELGSEAEPQALLKRVRQLQQGLPAEDEFALLLSWLGKCSIVHQLDQLQLPPDSKHAYRVPDLLIVFHYKGREIPALVEVKTTAKKRLSWRPDYYDSLLAYAHRLNLPLLIAWRCTQLGFWVLCDSSLFELRHTNYHLAHETALKGNLMCELAGDFMYVFRPGVGLHLKFQKLKRVSSGEADGELWHLRVKDAYFVDSEGNHMKTLGPGLWLMFLGAEQDTETDSHPEYFDHRFFIPEESSMQSAHLLFGLATMGIVEKQPVPWRQLMQNHRFAIDGPNLAAAARSAIDGKIVRYVFHQQPVEVPKFLQSI